MDPHHVITAGAAWLRWSLGAGKATNTTYQAMRHGYVIGRDRTSNQSGLAIAVEAALHAMVETGAAMEAAALRCDLARRLSTRQAASELGISRVEYRRRVDLGRAWLAGWLAAKRGDNA